VRSPFNVGHRITSGFGTRILNGKSEQHNGIDMVPTNGPVNTDICAPFPGTVTHVISHLPNSHTGLNVTSNLAGNLIRYKTAASNSIMFYHLQANSVRVNVGDKVETGQVLARLGNTGRSTGAHLHYELWDKNGVRFNPVLYLGNEDLLPGDEEEMKREQYDKWFAENMVNYLANRGTLPISPWAESELAEAVDKGITDGTRPQAFLTRQEGAIMALRAVAHPAEQNCCRYK
jgi:hypothetical protein